ncbi:MAG: enediyne biosynthesis protein [Acidobacteriota bacterium]
MRRWQRAGFCVLGCAVLVSLIGATPPADLQFRDVTRPAGIDFTHENSATSSKYLVETMGGGVALLDYDNDGRLDVFFTNGAKIDDPMPDGKRPDKSDRKFWNRLYHQNEDGTFSDVTEKAGLTGMPQNYYGMGVATGDYDNDGFEDLYVTSYGGNTLYHNERDGTFADVTKTARVGGGGWSASAGFLDYDNDGKLDLFVARYVEWTFQNNRYCGEKKPGYRAYCHPDNYDGTADILYHNEGDGTFTDVSSKAGIANSNGKGLGVSFADYDHDGFTDIYVANDSVQSFLYRNNGNGTFSEVGVLAGVGFNEDGKTFAGMGAEFADYDNDGRPDILVTDLSNERYKLFRQNGDGSFRDQTDMSGLGGATLPFSGWSARFFDYDNDGWKDIFAAQGHVMDTIEKTAPNLKYLQPLLLLRNDSGHFVRVMPGEVFQKSWAGRGAAFGDIDNDGDVDVVVSNLGQTPLVLRNDGGNGRNWLAIRTTGTTSNRDGLGCQVKVVSASGLTQYFTINTAAGYLSASDKRLVVGLGGDSTARLVEIRWPSGIVQSFDQVKSGQTLAATEPSR